jgi:hypothetical protein
MERSMILSFLKKPGACQRMSDVIKGVAMRVKQRQEKVTPKGRVKGAILMSAAALAASAAAPVFARNVPVPSALSQQPRQPLRVRQVTPLQFGSFVAGAGSGSLRIDPHSGSRSSTGGITGFGGGYGRAVFEITGEPGASFTVLLPREMSLVSHTQQPGVLAMRELVSDPEDKATLGPDGKASIAVGGVLQPAGRMTKGDYSGLFPITVFYQ